MNKSEYLTFEEYKVRTAEMQGDHWKPHLVGARWDYHLRTINLIKALDLPDASKILEMGTMGVKCVKNSRTIDFAEKWDFPGKEPDYLHDARQIPWPIADKEYDLFVALRVFQHLTPKQQQCFDEAVRISKKIILVVDEEYNIPAFPESKGISYSDFVKYLNGVHPNIFTPTLMGNLYYWDLENPSYLNLEGVIKSQYIKTGQIAVASKPGLIYRIKRKVKRIIG